ncbi:PE family protein [Mycobacterium asiaticum]|uniref:PE family protein n=1 Tax=Mycobacterium asiaticum TaxID=1790 RepID=A0A1A3CDN0_MYCAS|nr:PE-PPE domain-containing protein [Mycobacterium asiaticum]OBI84778.1 PE family protein [Mycobacterium asiaticum]
MSFLTTQPQFLTAAAENLAGIQASLAQANAAVAGPTTGVAAAAADEVSIAISNLFGQFGQDYQALLQHANAFHTAFTQALTSGANAYAQAETTAQAMLMGGATTAAAPAAAQTSLQGTIYSLIIGGSGTPIPSQTYVDKVFNYVQQTFPSALLANAQALFTPEGLQPIYTGIKSLPLDTSVMQGLQILDNSINSTLAAHAGDSVSVLGYSQSAIIASLEMRNLLGNPLAPAANQLGFTLLGDPMNPNGGLLARFPGLNLPSLGLDFYGATPPNTQYATNIYTLQYDGFADFPRYPLNLLSDLNAFLGIQTIHGQYPNLDPAHLPAGYNLVTLPGSNALTGQGETNYYMITHPNLPLTAPLRAIPVIGNPLADLVEPDLRILVNLGYGDPNFGYSTSPANVPTPFGVIPDVNWLSVGNQLVAGAQQGANAFLADIGAMTPSAQSVPAMLTSAFGSGGAAANSALAAVPTSTNGIINAIETANTTVTNAFTNATSNAYAVFLPTLDIANALVTTMPSYDLNLFLNGMEQIIDGDPTGGLIYALGAPLAADTAITTLAAGFQLIVLLNTVESILGIG